MSGYDTNTINNVVEGASVQDSYQTTPSNSANKQSKKSGFMLNTVGYLTLSAMVVATTIFSGCASTQSKFGRNPTECEIYAKARAFVEAELTPGPSPMWSLDGLSFTRNQKLDVQYKNADKTLEQAEKYHRLVDKYRKECNQSN